MTSNDGPSAATSSVRILRRVDKVTIAEQQVDLSVIALSAINLGLMPGWLTGETLEEQGIEVTMPNLPNLDLPELEGERWQLRVTAHGARTVRLLLAPAGHRVFDEQPSWLGIVTNDDRTAILATEDDGQVVVSGADFTLIVGLYPFTVRLENHAGRTILRTAERLRQVAGFPLAPPVMTGNGGVSINFELGSAEDILGFGEQFGRLVKNGQQLVLRSEDALGTGTGLAYKPVPVWHSTAGYAGFINTGATINVDVGHIRPSVFSLQPNDSAIDLFLFVSDSPAERLADYTALTGTSLVPPVWAFGYWMGRCRYHSSEEMLQVARNMNKLSIPCDVLHLDPDWLVTDRLNTDFIWNESRFGNRKQFVQDLALEGKRLSVWELPYVDPASPIYDHLEKEGYFVKTSDGATAHLGGTPTPDGRWRALIDFTNVDANLWWRREHRAFLDDGVAVFKTDFGEGFPDDGVLSEDTPSTHHHNLYPLRYNRSTSTAIAEYTGRPPLVWGRSGWAGSHRYPGQWGGDAESTVAGMQATLRGGLSYALCAPGFWSHDIGGFFGPELTDGLYVRWTQFGAFSPLMRAHGLRPREPWAFSEEALAISREWIRRRYELLPQLWQIAQESVRLGLPMMRPMHLVFPADPASTALDSQFMLGNDLLVVPIFDDGIDDVQRTFYVPNGIWTDLYDETTYVGPGYHTAKFALGHMPVLVRDGAFIATTALPESTRSTEDLLSVRWVLRQFGTHKSDAPTVLGYDSEPLRRDEFDVVFTTT